jgi:1-deoxy-D-xylulose-5-phosphate synthase
VAVRYPRGAGVGVVPAANLSEMPWGKADLRRSTGKPSAVGGPRIAILAFGTLLYPALKAAEKLDATVVNMRFVKPLDVDMVLQIASTHEAIVTVEEGSVMGGAGSAVGECLAANGLALPMLQLGLPDKVLEHGDPQTLLSMCGLDAAGIEQAVQQRFGTRLTVVRPAAAG